MSNITSKFKEQIEQISTDLNSNSKIPVTIGLTKSSDNYLVTPLILATLSPSLIVLFINLTSQYFNQLTYLQTYFWNIFIFLTAFITVFLITFLSKLKLFFTPPPIKKMRVAQKAAQFFIDNNLHYRDEHIFVFVSQLEKEIKVIAKIKNQDQLNQLNELVESLLKKINKKSFYNSTFHFFNQLKTFLKDHHREQR